ncbi:glycerol kinase [Panacagrimonas perspica]|uniref:Glycerol kinase n=1 Tax=Panacagrimonas perspica TaxID=381431 RepID=A0A4R7P4S9_9GAMM|nr:glycerol kinase GlpK [Panacagrimonas perspica]TDU28668.1 glycerol kinase [Panacagrimonas perspica]THD04995.1 glycerol kinase [Panacagrimonas perspica]
MKALLAIDQGTTSTRAIVFDAAGHKLGTHQVELPQSFPKPGWVEHDALQIRDDAIACVRGALKAAKLGAKDIAGIGITNQRETAVIWDRKSGKPIHPAIVWQDRRTADFCAKHADRSEWLSERTGLLLDPYFSATKIAWMLEHVDGARARAENGELAFGTIDSWLLWTLTGGKVHATDASNASRTALFNLRTQDWDDELLTFFGVPRALLPEVMDCAAEFGATDGALFDGAIPIRGILGDQQAATVGQACFAPGMIKSTYGTGCFMVLNTGEEFVRSRNKLLSTVAYRFGGKTTYALEGSIFVAGAAVQWLRDAVHLIESAGDTEKLARSIEDTEGVYLVPAFTGLGAPYWDPQARGAIFGLTRNSGIAHIVRAALESVCYQTRDLLGAMREDAMDPTELRIDGGMVVNDFVAQSLADILQVAVVRPATVETTALGAAFAAGLQAGVYDSLDSISKLWEAEAHFKPALASKKADALYAGWQTAVERVRSQPGE